MGLPRITKMTIFPVGLSLLFGVLPGPVELLATSVLAMGPP